MSSSFDIPETGLTITRYIGPKSDTDTDSRIRYQIIDVTGGYITGITKAQLPHLIAWLASELYLIHKEE